MVTDGMQPGEIERTLERIERTLDVLGNDVRARHHRFMDELTKAVGALGEHNIRLGRAEYDLNELGKKVESVKAEAESELMSVRTELGTIKESAARMSAGAATLAFVASFIPWPWKH